ncbi:MAG: AAA family ATPase [Alphaproteobacteria bacterium]|nr:AAA family ATPase [Alphaproteobacteria bacterium]
MDLHHWSKLGNPKRHCYLVKNLIEDAGLSVIYRESNSGKTFLALDLAAHISLGWSWQNRKVKKSAVVYIAAESGLGIGERVQAFRNKHHTEAYGDLFLALRAIIL